MNNDRSIWQSIKQIFAGSADAITSLTITVSKTAQIGESLAQAGLIMAQSNEQIVTRETEGKRQAKLAELNEKYPELEVKD